MLEDFEYKGNWFIPSEPENQINGILRFNVDTGSTLELFGGFGEPFDMKDGGEDIILGVTNNGKDITCYKSFVTQGSGLSLRQGKKAGYGNTIYTVNYVLVGTHIFEVEKLKFQKLKAKIKHLDQWLGISGFQRNVPDIDKIREGAFTIDYKVPQSVCFNINKKIDASFDFDVNFPGLSRYDEEMAIKQKVELIFNSTDALSINEWLKHLFAFQNFLVMGIYDKTYPTQIEFTSNELYDEYSDGDKVLHKIELFIAISNRDLTATKAKYDLDMLFCYRDISSDFTSIIKKWFEKYEILNPAFNLVFEHFYNSKRFSENTFLNLAQAAETFHSRTRNHTKIPKADYKAMTKEVYSAVNSKLHPWLKEQFMFGNNLNLAQRLDEIIQLTSNKVLDAIIGDKKKFGDEIRWTRNYYTHYAKDGEKKALKGTPLFYISEKLKIVMICAFMIEIGFAIQQVEELLERSKWRLFNHLTKW